MLNSSNMENKVDKRYIDEKYFIRQKIYSDEKSQLKKYSELVIGKTSLISLLKYELIIGIFGSIPGALGLILRKWFYPSLFKKIGKGVIFGKNLSIRHPDKIVLGDNVFLDNFALLDGRGSGDEGLTIGDNTIVGRGVIMHSKVGPISIGNNCSIGSYSFISSQGGVRIGNWVQIAGGCKISGGLFEPDNSPDNPVPYRRYSKGRIEIGSKCFLGGSVQITDGISIGAGSMIGAGSIVMSNVPENSIFMPRPGMVIGKTDSEVA
jgi:acetyltransferase-like isoleucine patch superfamily enzyme